MDIKYDLDGYDCVTKCPFGFKIPLCESIIKVGSTACNNCKYFVDDDDENHIVKCKYKDMEERTFKLSLDKAKNWYNGSSQDLKRIALEVYSEEELTKVELPNSWEEFCNSYKMTNEEAFIREDCTIAHSVKEHWFFNSISDKNLLPSEESAKQHLALMQLHQLRDCYRQGWKPEWTRDKNKFCIINYFGKPDTEICVHTNIFLSFQSPEIRDKFFENFKDLIEEAGDLI